MLEEGLGTYFSHKYVKREYGIDYDGVIYSRSSRDHSTMVCQVS